MKSLAAILTSLGAGIDALLSLGYPEVCQLCGNEPASKDHGYVGQRCHESLHRLKPPFCERCALPLEAPLPPGVSCANCVDLTWYAARARSVWRVNPTALELIRRYKYHEAMWVEGFLTRMLLEAIRDDPDRSDWDAVVAVPLHALRQRERSFNQADRLARGLGKGLEKPYLSGAMKRIAPTISQTMLTRSQRVRNVEAAFRVLDPGRIQGKRLLLIDDVLTTGATTNACAKMLMEAGARDVWVWTLLRGSLDGEHVV